MLYFTIASVYYSEALYQKAVDFYNKIELKELEKQQIVGDLILFNKFMCYYSLLKKDKAKDIIKTCEEFYSASDYLSSMRQMPILPFTKPF